MYVTYIYIYIYIYILVLSIDKIFLIAINQPGQNVTLPCRGSRGTIIVVEWSRTDLGSEYVLRYRDQQLDPENQNPSFRNRVDLLDPQMKAGDVSVVLKNLTTDDRGTYECRVVQRGTRRRKRGSLKTRPVSSVVLDVVPSGQFVRVCDCFLLFFTHLKAV
uniref:Ig-like domain-containing protein n=1 Tax=Cyprinodon variegatus TaxID=28743 RepID=A0A3Q2DG76_CYPVA